MGAKRIRKNRADWNRITHKTTQGTPSADYVCTMINPVDKRVYNVIATHGTYTEIVAPFPLAEYKTVKDLPVFAEGHFDSSDEKEIEEATYYRSHTPSGVAAKGKGYGYLLYSGMSLTVAMVKGQAGVYSSRQQRSGDATRWWSAQVKQGYALEGSDYMQGMTNVRIDIEDQITSDDIDTEYALGQEADDVTIEDVDPRYVDAEVTVSGAVEIQYLPAWKVAEEGIVIAWNPDDRDLDELFSDAKFPSVEVLSELNLDTVEDPNIIVSIFKLLDEDSDTTDDMRLRLLNTVDKDVWEANEEMFVRLVGKQLELPLIANRRKRVNKNAKVTYSKEWKQYFGDAIHTDANMI